MEKVKSPPPEEKAWKQWSKQTFMPFVTNEERIKLAFLNGFLAAKKLADAKEERRAKRARR